MCVQVKSLIAKGEKFEREEVTVMAEKVRQLQSEYKSVEKAGSHTFLNELRALNASLIDKWEGFENSLATHMSNLDLSLKFQETLFEVQYHFTAIESGDEGEGVVCCYGDN